ncbi:PH domain-containing protein [Candidatus Micrarchaeota archaeon]|nr:PH domain-containing protein [Candidatus Micrarchaeota archaeon]
MEETYKLSPKIKLLWSVEYIIGIIVLWIILSAVYYFFFFNINFLLLSPDLPILSYIFILLILIIFIGLPAYIWIDMAYRNFSYTIGENEVLIRTGVLHKRRIDIPYAAIENVSIEKPLYQRFFGLGTLNLDTAGGNEKEGIIPGIEDTDLVMGEILKRVAEVQGKGKTIESNKGEETIHVLKDILTELKDIKDNLKQNNVEKAKKSANMMDIEEFEDIFKKRASKTISKNKKR